MDSFQKILDSHESWLIDTITLYVRQSGYPQSPLNGACRLSVAGLSASLARAVPAFLAKQVQQVDSLMDPVVVEAKRHRERGIRLGTFLGVFKHYRQAYHDLLDHVAWESSIRAQYQHGLHKCFDFAEIRFCDEWNSLSVEACAGPEARGFPGPDVERLESLVEERTAELREANAKLHLAEQEWRRTFDAVPHLLAIVDADDKILKVNRAMGQWLEAKTEGVLAKTWTTIAAETGLPPCPHDGQPREGETYVGAAEGLHETGVFEVTVAPLFNHDAEYVGAVYDARDISRRKNAEEGLIQSRLLIQSALDALTQDIAILDETGVVVFVNKAWAAGKEDGGPFVHRSAVGSDFTAICDGVNRESCTHAAAIGSAIRRMLSGQSTGFSSEFPCPDPDSDHERWVCFIASSFSVAGSRRVLVSFTEITDRKRAERDLERKNDFLTTVLESLTHPFVVIDAHDFSVSLSNSASGIPRSAIRPKCYKAFHGRSQPCDGVDYSCPVRTVGQTGNAVLVEHEHQTDNQGVRCVEVHAYPVLDRDRKVTKVIQYMLDITQRKTAEVALRESEQKLDGILAAITDHLIMIDSDLKIVWVNDVAKGVFGSDLLGRGCYEALCTSSVPCEGCAIADCMADGKPHDRDQTVVLPNQDTVHLWCTTNVATRYDDGRPKTFVKILRDVTDLKKTQELLLQTEGLRAISELTTGVAHNFRNLLQVIMSAARLASMEMKDNNLGEADLALEQILRASHFGAGTIKRIEEFAKAPDDLPLKPDDVFDVSVTVEQAIEMSKPLWKVQPQRRGITIQVQRELEPGAWVKGQEGELFEVILNLLRNAVEAFRSDGIITVRTSVKRPAVFVTVQDTGPGISTRNLRNVFEPFWTTKFGRGSGMGLATSRRIVMNHQGAISVESLPGAGSTFTIRLPLVANPGERRVAEPREVQEVALNILVIDDVEQAADFLSKALAHVGHSVVSSFSGEEGLSRFQSGHFDVILCDLCMPGMSGLEVGKRVKDICRERGVRKPPFVLVTGWADQKLQAKELETSGVDGLLEKPADLSQIQQLIRKMTRKRPH